MNDYDSTYVFFKSLILLKLFKPKIGLIRQIGLFLYKWDVDAKRTKNKGRKNPLRLLHKSARKTKTSK